MEEIAAEHIDDIEAATGSQDGQHVSLRVRIDGQEHVLAVRQGDVMDMVTLLMDAHDSNEARHGEPQALPAVRVEDFDVMLGNGGRLVIALGFGDAGRLSFGLEPEDAEALARIIMAWLGRSDQRPN